VVSQNYETETHNVYVIRGNSGVLKCEIPSFVADFVRVDSWQTTEGQAFFPSDNYNGKNENKMHARSRFFSRKIASSIHIGMRFELADIPCEC
jgi:hypothetical protein